MTQDAFALDDSVVVVTGGSRGIGEAIAVAMGRAGAAVVPAARSEDALIKTAARVEEADGEAMAVPLDVTDEAAIKALSTRSSPHTGVSTRWSTMPA